MLRASAFCAFVLAAGTLAAQHEYTPGDIEDGGRLFRAACALCHGPDGEQVPGVDLGRGKFKSASTDADLIQVIQKGVPGTAMPANPFDRIQAGYIVAYLRSMAASAAGASSTRGDLARGKAVFEGKGGCTGCHRVKNAGSRIGPDLTAIGNARRAVELEKSILEPDAEILPQNRYARVVTKDGASVTGRLLNQDAFTVLLMDPKEQLRAFQRTNVKEYTILEKSSMPSYKEKLSQQELADVVSYLVSLKGI